MLEQIKEIQDTALDPEDSNLAVDFESMLDALETVNDIEELQEILQALEDLKPEAAPDYLSKLLAWPNEPNR